MADEIGTEVLIAEYTGAFFFWMIKGFKGKLSTQLIDKNYKRNLYTGYIINLAVFISIIVFFFIH
jgi:hypothetical protein